MWFSPAFGMTLIALALFYTRATLIPEAVHDIPTLKAD